jgi:putative transposase
MPRKPRFFLPGIPAHIVQRGHSREPVFFEAGDYQAYLGWLKEAAVRYGCDIHAYVLMTNHVHLLATPAKKDSISRMMQYIGRRYVPYINHTYGTSGSIWEGRFKASLISDEQYLLTCMRYIELNPVRANMVASPAQYRWSSYRYNAQGREDVLVAEHPLYSQLGKTVSSRWGIMGDRPQLIYDKACCMVSRFTGYTSAACKGKCSVSLAIYCCSVLSTSAMTRASGEYFCSEASITSRLEMVHPA